MSLDLWAILVAVVGALGTVAMAWFTESKKGIPPRQSRRMSMTVSAT